MYLSFTLYKKFLLLYLFICLITYFYHHGFMILFLLWTITQYYLVLLLKLIQDLAIESPSVGSYIPFSCHPSLSGFVSFKQFLTFYTTRWGTLYNMPGSSYIFLVPVLESTVSLRILGFFYWRKTLEPKIWALSVLAATQCQCF